ncbi:MAG: hypothetical protein QG623_36, partial [Patescibacteria group bacterium]|nr:hypothetical protein [Patescibacteria group bacterium]
FEQAGIKVQLAARIVSAAASSTGNLKELELVTKDNEQLILKTEAIMIASGKKMRDGDGLSNAGIHCDKGLIATNAFGQTASPNIYAIGDAAGPYRLTSTALMQAKTAAHNILAGRSRKSYQTMDYLPVPSCIFTMPEVAKVGESTTSLKARGVQIKESLVELSEVTRSHLEPTLGGFVKLWVDASSRRILGACLVGPSASEQISLIALAVKSGMTTTELAGLTSVFPTWSEAILLASSEL